MKPASEYTVLPERGMWSDPHFDRIFGLSIPLSHCTAECDDIVCYGCPVFAKKERKNISGDDTGVTKRAHRWTGGEDERRALRVIGT